MIAILYPKDDYTAADIGVKINALALNQKSKIYVVPKHYGRNQQSIYANLKKAKEPLLLMHDTTTLDSETAEELNFLLQNQVAVNAIIPQKSNLGLAPRNFNGIHEYDPKDPNGFLKPINEYLTSIGKQNTNKNTGVVLGLLAIILLGIAFSSDGKK
jgi:hypothetical protein